MTKYNLPSGHAMATDVSAIDRETAEAIWQLFRAICRRWGNVADPDSLKTRVASFLLNRIQLDACYVAEYREAVKVIEELALEHGGLEAAYEVLLTDPLANMAPPFTKLQRARQKVANELISLQLALGGFAFFGQARNYPGYISGVNGSGPAPYRVYPPAP
jgi:hypothetical protein